MIYEYKSNSRIKVKPQIAGEVCERLAGNGGLTAKRLLDESRDAGAPLHDEFEWNDAIAAENYRENQAAYIIRALVVRQEKQGASPVRAFINIQSDSRDYRPINVVIQSVDMNAQMLAAALRELEAFRQKYETLSELAPLWSAMDTFEVVADKAAS